MCNRRRWARRRDDEADKAYGADDGDHDCRGQRGGADEENLDATHRDAERCGAVDAEGERVQRTDVPEAGEAATDGRGHRSEEHTSELQSLMRTPYAVFCLQPTKRQAHIYP